MTADILPREGRHRRSGYVLPESPSESEKASYAWRSLPFLATALSVSALCLIVAQVWFEVRYVRVLPVVVGAFAAYTAAYLVYQVVSLPVNFAGRGFDLAAHRERVRR